MESITLQTNDAIISSGDSIGQLQFAASNESDGSASRYVIGKIYAQGEGVFNASSNPASLVFATSATDNLPASGKLKVSHEGHFLPLEDSTYDIGSANFYFDDLYVNSGIFRDGITVNGVDVSIEGHTHESSDIIDFATSVSGLLPVLNVSAGPAISVVNNSGDFVVSVSGDLSELTNVTARNVLFNVRNDNSSIKYAGQAIYASGIHANKVIIPGLYVSDDSIPEIMFMGLAREDIPINSEGQVVHFGTVENVATDGSASNIGVGDETWIAGDILYAHPTAPGKLTKYPPKHELSIALVLYAHQNQGILQVRPIRYPHIHELHDVDTSGVSNGQYLKYDSTSEEWKPGDPWKILTDSDFTTVTGSGFYFQAENNGRYVLPFNSVVPLLPYEILDPSGTSGANYSLFIQNDWYYKIGGTTYDSGELNKKIINREYRSGFGAGWFNVEYTNHEHTVSQITDINTSGVADNNFLVWNSGNEVWEPSTTLTFDGTTLHTDTDGISAIFGRNNSLTNGGKVRILVDDNDTASSVQAIKAFNNKTTGTNYGINATANGLGATKNVGLYGWAAQATTNWGLWVDAGYSIFDDRVGIKTSSPSYELHVNGSGNITGDMIVGGNLTIQGNTVTANVATMEIEDPIFTLGLASGTIVTDTNLDRGLALALNNDVMAFMGWDVSESEFALLSSGVASNGSGNYAPGTYGDLHIGGLTATTANFSSTIDAANLGAGEDNSVVILDSDGKLRTDEIDSRVWGSSLVDGAGSANHIAYWTDANTLSYDNSQLYWDATNDRLGIGKTSPGVTLDVKGDAIKINSDGSDYVSFDMNIYETSLVTKSANAFFSLYKGSNIGPTIFNLIIDGSDNTDSQNSAISIQKTPGSSDFNVNINKTSGQHTFEVGGTGNFDGDVYASGNVGIGTASPANKLDVVGSDNTTIASFSDGTDGVQIATRGTGRQQIDFIGSNIASINAKSSLYLNYDSDNSGSNDGIIFARNNNDESGTIDAIITEGKVGIGTNSPTHQFTINNTGKDPDSAMQSSSGSTASMYNEGANLPGLLISMASSNSYTHRGSVYMNRSRGTLDAPDAVASGDWLGSYYGAGYDGSALRRMGGVIFVTDGTVSAGNLPTSIMFQTGSSSRTEKMRIKHDGKVGIGTAYPEYLLDVNGSGNFSGDVSIDGHLSASTKSFLINHPTKEGKKLQYGSLESPYHGIRLTGRGTIQSGWCVIKLPEYICNLVRDDESVNIQITNYKHSKLLYVSDIDIANNEFTIKTDSWFTRNNLEFFWTFTAVRKDVEPLKVEF